MYDICPTIPNSISVVLPYILRIIYYSIGVVDKLLRTTKSNEARPPLMAILPAASPNLTFLQVQEYYPDTNGDTCARPAADGLILAMLLVRPSPKNRHRLPGPSNCKTCRTKKAQA
jgi:hypothetical protein